MRFKDNQLIWERYVDPYTQFGDQEETDPTLEDPLYPLSDDEDQEVVLEFEPEGAVEVDDDFDDMLEDGDDEHEMSELVMTDIKKLDRNTKKLLDYCASNKLEPWMQAKIVKAAVYVADVWDQLDDEADFANDGFEQSDNVSL